MMKKNNLIYMIVLSLVVFFVSCDNSYDPIQKADGSNAWTATISISELLSQYGSVVGDYPVRPNSGSAHLFSVDSIPATGPDIIIKGTVVSSDDAGNIYKYIVLQDPETGAALKISIDAGSLSAIMPIGQTIAIKCNGLAIGKYGDLFQLGIVYYNNNTDANKKGYEIGRIPYSMFLAKTQIIGMPDMANVRVDTMTIAEIQAAGRSVHSRLVCIQNASFNGYGEVNFTYKKLDLSEMFYGRPKPSITGVPVTREIEDGTGKMFIATSEYAGFAAKAIPDASYRGDITVIVGWYLDKVRSDDDGNNWQLTLRSLDDIGAGFEGYKAENGY